VYWSLLYAQTVITRLEVLLTEDLRGSTGRCSGDGSSRGNPSAAVAPTPSVGHSNAVEK
jgi:hypothetical protein